MGPKKIKVPKNISSKKMLCLKKLLVQKNVGSEKNFVSKNFFGGILLVLLETCQFALSHWADYTCSRAGPVLPDSHS